MVTCGSRVVFKSAENRALINHDITVRSVGGIESDEKRGEMGFCEGERGKSGTDGVITVRSVSLLGRRTRTYIIIRFTRARLRRQNPEFRCRLR